MRLYETENEIWRRGISKCHFCELYHLVQQPLNLEFCENPEQVNSDNLR